MTASEKNADRRGRTICTLRHPTVLTTRLQNSDVSCTADFGYEGTQLKRDNIKYSTNSIVLIGLF